jgi:hypothetical protein
MAEIERCKYFLPCGYCDKYDIPCKASKENLANYYGISDVPKECEHNWQFVQQYWNSETHKFFNKYVCTECGNVEYRVDCFQPNT